MLRRTTKIIIYSTIIIGLALIPLRAHAQIDTDIEHMNNIAPKSNVIPHMHALCKILYPPAPNHNANLTMINMCTSSHLINAYRYDQGALIAIMGGNIISSLGPNTPITPEYAAKIKENRIIAIKNCTQNYPEEKTICNIIGAYVYPTTQPNDTSSKHS